MRFYRGIAVPSDKAQGIIAAIQHGGLIAGQGTQWSMINYDLKPRLDELRRLNPLSLAETRSGPTQPRVCACGDKGGAAYYACTHNKSAQNDSSIIITFEADIDDVIIDGRDFLYTVFQGGDPARAREPARKLFGDALLPYLDRAWKTTDQQERVALCDLATQDDDVIRAHVANTIVMGGRYRTLYRSAFMVRLPVPGARVTDVRATDCSDAPVKPEISLAELRKL
jgi:hypothetical protein